MRLVGHSHPIHDAVAKATGRAVYAGDMSLPGMLHAAVVFSSIPHGMVKSIDVSAALALPGVVDVIHCFNTTQNLFSRFRFMAGDEPLAQEKVFNDHVRFIGDRIGCVIAEKPEIARKAVKLVRVDYEALPFCTDPQQARQTGIIDAIHGDGAVYGDYVYDHGTPPSPGSNIGVTKTTSSLARITHVALEPHACVAAYDKAMDELTVWSANQSVYGVRTILGDLFEMPYHKIRVVKTTMGGSFGGKQEWMVEPVAAAAALRTGRPVKLVFSRAETMTSTITRPPLSASVTSRVDTDGHFESFDLDVTVDAGAYLGSSYVYMITISNKLHRVYRIPHVHYVGRAVCTNTPVSGGFRGWGSPELYLMLEHNLDMTARRLGMDPIELRLRNVAMPGDFDPKYERDVGPIRIKECLERGREWFAWDRLKSEDRDFNAGTQRYRRGVGVACGGHAHGFFPKRQDFAAADMRLTESGSVQANITLHDHGCGTITALKMIIAETLGISVDMVLLKEGDTAVTPMDIGCYASRTTYVLGEAARQCA
jgi:CO/xanthine dehydrogenase Mo-binding subunit